MSPKVSLISLVSYFTIFICVAHQSVTWTKIVSHTHQTCTIVHKLLDYWNVGWFCSVADTLNTEPTSKQVKTGFSKSPLNILFPCLTSWKTGEGEEEEEGEEEGESEEGEEEEVQLEIISDSITQGTTPEVWQMNVNPIPPVTSGPPTSQSTSTPVRLPGQQIL